MPNKRSFWIISILMFAIGLGATDSGASNKRTKGERSATKARLICQHAFPFSITWLELTPNGYLHAVARDDKGKKATKSRYLLDGSCNRFWKGDESRTAVLADDPYPVVMEVDSNGLVLKAVDPSGAVKWTYPMPGVPASTASDAASKTLAMVVMPYEWAGAPSKGYPAKVVAVDMKTGTQKWSAEAGTIEGSLDSFGGELGVSGGDLWWAAGGRAFCVEMASGKVKWSAELKDAGGSGSIWNFTDAEAYVARGGRVAALSGSGVVWQKEFSGDVEPRGLGATSSGVIATFATEKDLIVAFLDRSDGTVKWEKRFSHKEKKYGAPPSGVAFSDARAAVFAGDRLIGLDLSDGGEVYSDKVKSKKFLGIDELRSGTSGAVIIGTTGAASYSVATGAQNWEEMDFVDPVFETQKTKAAVMQLGMSSAASLMTAPGAEKAWKEYRDGSRNFTSAAQTAAFEQQMFVQQAGERGKQMGAGIGKLVDIEITLVNRRLGPTKAEFYGHRDGGFAFLKDVQDLDIVEVNLLDGSTYAIPLSKSRSGCIPQAMIDPVSRKVVQTYRQMGLLCKDENTVEIYGY